MVFTKKYFSILIATSSILVACGGSSNIGITDADTLLGSAGSALGLNAAQYRKKITGVVFPDNWHVFFPSTLAIDFKTQVVKLPLYSGTSPKGTEYFIITEASDFDTATQLGVNYSPKLINAISTGAVQTTTFDKSGHLVFEGSVDFSPVRSLGVSNITANATALQQVNVPVPGAVGDSKYSPLVQLPSGVVLNITYVSNATGEHDHIVGSAGGIDTKKMSASLGFLDGYQGGKRYYFHLVTDSNNQGPAAIEGGTYAPRLALLTTFGQDLPTDRSPLLAFSPVGNGQPAGDPQQQGLNSLIYNYKLDLAAGRSPSFKPDPINVFPLQPKNTVADTNNNYSPLWDAHILSWVNPANAFRITGIDQLKQLIATGQVTSLGAGSTVGNLIPLVPNGLLINCPVLAQPDESVVQAL